MAVTVIVEDGTGKIDANSYGSVADADAYFVDRGNGIWAALTTDVKGSSLIKATDYIEQRYGGSFIGSGKTTTTQALAWPRLNADPYTDAEIPANLKKACFEYAYRASQGPLAPDLTLDASGVQTFTAMVKVGPIEKQTQAAAAGTGSKPTTYLLRPYPGADMWLRGLVVSNDAVIR